MSRSYRSQKESAIAERRIARRADGRVVLPRIVEGASAVWDRHPLTKRALAKLLPTLPREYLYGLSRIELRARHRPAIGRPYGVYWPDERAIVLYSLPKTRTWAYGSIEPAWRASFERFGAVIKAEGKRVRLSWPIAGSLARWFYSEVFAHELGHHFIQRYQGKNGRIDSRGHEERVADLHARRLARASAAALDDGDESTR